MTELFIREGYSIISAACAQEAREKLSGNVNLIVLDVGLPDGDGVSLCQQWRSAGVAVPILFLTAKDEEFDVVRGLDAGGNDYVTKPFHMMELLSHIRALLRTSRNQISTMFSRSGGGSGSRTHASLQRRRAVASAPDRVSIRFQLKLFV